MKVLCSFYIGSKVKYCIKCGGKYACAAFFLELRVAQWRGWSAICLRSETPPDRPTSAQTWDAEPTFNFASPLWVLDECARQNVLLQPCHDPIECIRRAGGRLVQRRRSYIHQIIKSSTYPKTTAGPQGSSSPYHLYSRQSSYSWPDDPYL